MEQNINCEKCNELMHQIGPFARKMEEGQSAHKWNGYFEFECTNGNCQNKGKIIKIKI
ncbi:MAG: hypothetical protein O210_OD1C00001G0642 [Parcubacteria bacterium RAAC4_OD1_1]|nr:MAG: hypothetical protein O210_OD1C00001G0642 [Parcubacteria bacterium RAAC4_OD1_1]